MQKWLLIILIAYGGFNWYQKSNTNGNASKGYAYGNPHNELIMYSLTTCGYCKQKVKQLKKERIDFKEYFIDVDNKRRNELFSKLEKSGYPSRGIGTPTFDVHGIMLPNNPEMSEIKLVLKNTEIKVD